MGASHKIKNMKTWENRTHASSRAMWSAPSPQFEAKALFQLAGRGVSVDEIRDLIAIPRDAERTLLAYAAENPEESNSIERVIGFRRRVAEEFERLVGKLSKALDFPDYPQSVELLPTSVDSQQVTPRGSFGIDKAL